MVDREIIDWIKRELNHITGYIAAVDKRCAECRSHCDKARRDCAAKCDYEQRIRDLELKAVETTTGSWKGAKLIATCAVVSGFMGVAGNLIARLF